jgi:hypothetical protein
MASNLIHPNLELSMNWLVGMAELYGWSPPIAGLMSGSQLLLESFDQNVFGGYLTLSIGHGDIGEDESHSTSRGLFYVSYYQYNHDYQ